MMQFRHFIEWFFTVSLYRLIRLLPARVRFSTGSMFGYLFYLLGVRRSVAEVNLMLSGVCSDQKDAKKILKRCYSHFGRGMTEFLYMNTIRWREGQDYRLFLPDDFVTTLNNGAILISAHIGNWEIMGKILAEKKIPLAVAVRQQANIRTDRWFRRLREQAGMTVVKDNDIWRMIDLLRKGYALALLSDQDLGGRSEIVPFFGRLCRTPAGAAWLMLHFQIPAWIAYALRQNDSSFSFYVERFARLPGDDYQSICRRINSCFEAIIRQNPDQWFWMHRRWKI